MTDYIRNNKALVFIISILLISNIALLFFFLNGKKDGNRTREQGSQEKQSMRVKMINSLRDSVGFDTVQIAQYEKLSDEHKKVIKPLFQEIKKTKDSLYKLLTHPDASDSLISSFLDKIGNDQRNIDQRIFQHFKSMRALCKPGQEQAFDNLTQPMIKQMISGPSHKGGDKDKKK